MTYDARGDAANTMLAAISSGLAMRPSGRPLPVAASASWRLMPLPAATWSARPPSSIHASLVVGPGQIAVERMPAPAYVSAIRRDTDCTAAFVTE